MQKNNVFQSLGTIEKLSGTDWPVYHLEHDELSDESKLRIAKVEDMRAQGIEPWPAARDVPDMCQEVLEQFEEEEYRPDLILDAGNLLNGSPSIVVDLTKKKPKILRP